MDLYQPPCVYEKYSGAANAPLLAGYRPREPHKTVLHQVLRENLETFLAEGMLNSSSGEGYPHYVEKEFREYLSCADLSRGFARVRCQDCGFERLLAFSCKRRGICPSCTGRRMSDEAAYLVDILLPQADYRQWTITFPWPVRFLMAKDYKLITALLKIVKQILFAWQRKQARRLGYKNAQTASVTFIQRFGGALNLNLHFHILLPDGVFFEDSSKEDLVLLPLPPVTDEQVYQLTTKLKRRVTRYLEKNFATVDSEDENILDGLSRQSMSNVSALGHLEQLFADNNGQDGQASRKRRCANIDGFGIHANTYLKANNRVGLEKICRYGMRPPFSLKRLSYSDGKVHLMLRRPWPRKGGSSMLSFKPTDFLRRLAPLIPPPYSNLVRYHGLFAPNAKLRDLLPAAPPSPYQPLPDTKVRALSIDKRLKQSVAAPKTVQPLPLQATHENSIATSTKVRKTLPWAELLRRTFSADPLICPRCLGPMTVLAYLTDAKVLIKILTHLGLPSTSPQLSPARMKEQLDFFDGEKEDFDGQEHAEYQLHKKSGRDPPLYDY